MKKRILGLIISLVSLICVVSAIGITAGSTEIPVARVGTTEYFSIDEAVANWKPGTTLTLLDNVTLNAPITFVSNESERTLNLGTYTMTAAEGKNAIEITPSARSSAGYALTVNADSSNPGQIIATGKACIYYRKTASTKDRSIIRINGGVFNGSNALSIYSSNKGTNCTQVYINGGIFNAPVNLTNNMLRISGGVFNATITCTGDQTAYRQITGGRFKSWGFFTADANTKFAVGTQQISTNPPTPPVYLTGVYVDADGYLVVGGDVITEAGTRFEASSNYSYWSSYLKYSSAAQYGKDGEYTDNVLFWESAATLMKKKTSGDIVVHTDGIDLTSEQYSGMNFKGTFFLDDENKTFAITFEEGTEPLWKVDTNLEGKIAVYIESNSASKITRTYFLRDELKISFNTGDGTDVEEQTVPDGYTATEPEAPTKEGHTFEGWYTDEECTQVFSFSDAITESVTLYAKFTLNKYDVILNYGVASEENGSVTVNHGETLNIDAPVFDGYIFMGWYTDEEVTAKFNLETAITGDLTLYAKFIDYNSDIEEINGAVLELNSAIEELNNAMAKDAEALAAAIKDLKGAKANIKTLLNNMNKYEEADTALKNEITAAMENADAALNSAIVKLQNDLDAMKNNLNDTELKLKTEIENLQTHAIITDVVAGIALLAGLVFGIAFLVNKKREF